MDTTQVAINLKETFVVYFDLFSADIVVVVIVIDAVVVLEVIEFVFAVKNEDAFTRLVYRGFVVKNDVFFYITGYNADYD